MGFKNKYFTNFFVSMKTVESDKFIPAVHHFSIEIFYVLWCLQKCTNKNTGRIINVSDAIRLSGAMKLSSFHTFGLINCTIRIFFNKCFFTLILLLNVNQGASRNAGESWRKGYKIALALSFTTQALEYHHGFFLGTAYIIISLLPRSVFMGESTRFLYNKFTFIHDAYVPRWMSHPIPQTSYALIIHLTADEVFFWAATRICRFHLSPSTLRCCRKLVVRRTPVFRPTGRTSLNANRAIPPNLQSRSWTLSNGTRDPVCLLLNQKSDSHQGSHIMIS